MKSDEAFRVGVIADMRAESLVTISRAWDRARELVSKILAPLALGKRLEFGCDQEPSGRGWLVVRIIRSGQRSLFPESGAIDLHGGSPEASAARALLTAHLAELKEEMRQFRVSGYQLDEVASRMLKNAELHAAFGVLSSRNKRVSVACGAVQIEDFALSPQPGRHIHPRVHRVRFWVKMIGLTEARIVVPKAVRSSIGARRAEAMLTWDQTTVDGTTWEYLANSMRQRVSLQAEVKIVFKSTGALAGLVMVRVERRDSSSLESAPLRSEYGTTWYPKGAPASAGKNFPVHARELDSAAGFEWRALENVSPESALFVTTPAATGAAAINRTQAG